MFITPSLNCYFWVYRCKKGVEVFGKIINALIFVCAVSNDERFWGCFLPKVGRSPTLSGLWTKTFHPHICCLWIPIFYCSIVLDPYIYTHNHEPTFFFQRISLQTCCIYYWVLCPITHKDTSEKLKKMPKILAKEMTQFEIEYWEVLTFGFWWYQFEVHHKLTFNFLIVV